MRGLGVRQFMATADLAEDSRDVEFGDTPQEPYASEMAEHVGYEGAAR